MEQKLEEMSAFFNARSATYDVVHTNGIDGGLESKKIPGEFLPEHCENLLDLGIGTGLELETVFRRFPEICVTGVDCSSEMLALLRKKYPDRNLELHQMSYFDYDFGTRRFDAAMTVMTLHHYTHAVKTELYRRILTALRPGGVYVECDFMIPPGEVPDPQAVEDSLFAEYARLKREQGLSDREEYHFDTPCTEENQIKMLRAAGFINVREVWRKGSTVVLVAEKPKGTSQ